MKFFYKLLLLLIMADFYAEVSFAQKDSVSTSWQENIDSSHGFRIVSPGPQYKRSKFHEFLWGKNYRDVWTTPVAFPLFYLKDHHVFPDELGGGHQTTSLHLKTKDDKSYALRSVDKQLGKVLPDVVLGTFAEDLADDEVSMANPYGAATVPVLSKAAGIYYIDPKYYYLPRQDALDTFNDKLAGKVYTFEQRLNKDWSNADNLGNFHKFYDTKDVIKKIEKETENIADQKDFLKARLLDALIGDWDRHEKQWGWGERKGDSFNVFVAVPQDRDQVFSKHEGVLVNLIMSAAGVSFIPSFSDKLNNPEKYNYEERGLDRFFTNQLTRNDWDSIARSLQSALTDSVIEKAVHQMPPEVFAISGKEIIKDLEARRDQLLNYADQYYLFLAREVELIGSQGTDYFTVDRLTDTTTSVKFFNIKKNDDIEKYPFYSRIFKTGETKKIRIFGLSGKDIYKTTGTVNKGITLQIIGGDKKDSMQLNSLVGKSTKTYVYDDKNNIIHAAGKVKKRFSDVDSVHKYRYMDYERDKKGLSPVFFYSDADRFYLGLNYRWEHHAWRKEPYVFNQKIGANYSISQNAMSFTYLADFPNTIGRWKLNLLANYDFISWRNFYGLGNETKLLIREEEYNRMRSREFTGQVGLSSDFGKDLIEVNGFYKTVTIVDDPERYVANKIQGEDPNVFSPEPFAGVNAKYTFTHVDDKAVPISGIVFSVNGSYTKELEEKNRDFWKYGSELKLFIPLFYKFSISTSAGIETVTGNPEFWQYPDIGGGMNLRGFRRQRFYGKTAFYNSNELRFISKVKNYFYSGKAGLLAFVDQGRVWMPDEKSNVMHVGYGGGVFLAPFNKIAADITYGFSKEDHLVQFRFFIDL